MIQHPSPSAPAWPHCAPQPAINWTTGLLAALALLLAISAAGTADEAAAEQARAEYSAWLQGVAYGDQVARIELAHEIALLRRNRPCEPGAAPAAGIGSGAVVRVAAASAPRRARSAP